MAMSEKLMKRVRAILDATTPAPKRIKLLAVLDEDGFTREEIGRVYREHLRSILQLYLEFVQLAEKQCSEKRGKGISVGEVQQLCQVLRTALRVVPVASFTEWQRDFVWEQIAALVDNANAIAVRKPGYDLLLQFCQLFVAAGESSTASAGPTSPPGPTPEDRAVLLATSLEWSALVPSNKQTLIHLPNFLSAQERLLPRRLQCLPKADRDGGGKEGVATEADAIELFVGLLEFIKANTSATVVGICPGAGVEGSAPVGSRMGFWWRLLRDRVLPLLYPSQCRAVGVLLPYGETAGFPSCPLRLQCAILLFLHDVLLAATPAAVKCEVVVQSREDLFLILGIFRHAFGSLPAAESRRLLLIMDILHDWVPLPQGSLWAELFASGSPRYHTPSQLHLHRADVDLEIIRQAAIAFDSSDESSSSQASAFGGTPQQSAQLGALNTSTPGSPTGSQGAGGAAGSGGMGSALGAAEQQVAECHGALLESVVQLFFRFTVANPSVDTRVTVVRTFLVVIHKAWAHLGTNTGAALAWESTSELLARSLFVLWLLNNQDPLPGDAELWDAFFACIRTNLSAEPPALPLTIRYTPGLTIERPGSVGGTPAWFTANQLMRHWRSVVLHLTRSTLLVHLGQSVRGRQPFPLPLSKWVLDQPRASFAVLPPKVDVVVRFRERHQLAHFTSPAFEERAQQFLVGLASNHPQRLTELWGRFIRSLLDPLPCSSPGSSSSSLPASGRGWETLPRQVQLERIRTVYDLVCGAMELGLCAQAPTPSEPSQELSPRVLRAETLLQLFGPTLLNAAAGSDVDRRNMAVVALCNLLGWWGCCVHPVSQHTVRKVYTALCASTSSTGSGTGVAGSGAADLLLHRLFQFANDSYANFLCCQHKGDHLLVQPLMEHAVHFLEHEGAREITLAALHCVLSLALLSYRFPERPLYSYAPSSVSTGESSEYPGWVATNKTFESMRPALFSCIRTAAQSIGTEAGQIVCVWALHLMVLKQIAGSAGVSLAAHPSASTEGTGVSLGASEVRFAFQLAASLCSKLLHPSEDVALAAHNAVASLSHFFQEWLPHASRGGSGATTAREEDEEWATGLVAFINASVATALMLLARDLRHSGRWRCVCSLIQTLRVVAMNTPLSVLVLNRAVTATFTEAPPDTGSLAAPPSSLMRVAELILDALSYVHVSFTDLPWEVAQVAQPLIGETCSARPYLAARPQPKAASVATGATGPSLAQASSTVLFAPPTTATPSAAHYWWCDAAGESLGGRTGLNTGFTPQMLQTKAQSSSAHLLHHWGNWPIAQATALPYLPVSRLYCGDASEPLLLSPALLEGVSPAPDFLRIPSPDRRPSATGVASPAASPPHSPQTDPRKSLEPHPPAGWASSSEAYYGVGAGVVAQFIAEKKNHATAGSALSAETESSSGTGLYAVLRGETGRHLWRCSEVWQQAPDATRPKHLRPIGGATATGERPQEGNDTSHLRRLATEPNDEVGTALGIISSVVDTALASSAPPDELEAARQRLEALLDEQVSQLCPEMATAQHTGLETSDASTRVPFAPLPYANWGDMQSGKEFVVRSCTPEECTKRFLLSTGLLGSAEQTPLAPLAHKIGSLQPELASVDSSGERLGFTAAVLYVAPAQWDFAAIAGNSGGSAGFNDFLWSLGWPLHACDLNRLREERSTAVQCKRKLPDPGEVADGTALPYYATSSWDALFLPLTHIVGPSTTSSGQYRAQRLPQLADVLVLYTESPEFSPKSLPVEIGHLPVITVFPLSNGLFRVAKHQCGLSAGPILNGMLVDAPLLGSYIRLTAWTAVNAMPLTVETSVRREALTAVVTRHRGVGGTETGKVQSAHLQSAEAALLPVLLSFSA